MGSGYANGELVQRNWWTTAGAAEWERGGADRVDGCSTDAGLQFERWRRDMGRSGNDFEYPVSFGCGRNSQWAIAVGGGRWSGDDLGGVGRLPISRRLYDERSCLQHVDGWSELGSGGEDSDRRRVEHRGSFHPGDRDRSDDFWRGSARGAALLLLFAEQLHGGNVSAGGGIHFFGEWRDELE